MLTAAARLDQRCAPDIGCDQSVSSRSADPNRETCNARRPPRASSPAADRRSLARRSLGRGPSASTASIPAEPVPKSQSSNSVAAVQPAAQSPSEATDRGRTISPTATNCQCESPQHRRPTPQHSPSDGPSERIECAVPVAAAPPSKTHTRVRPAPMSLADTCDSGRRICRAAHLPNRRKPKSPATAGTSAADDQDAGPTSEPLVPAKKNAPPHEPSDSSRTWSSSAAHTAQGSTATRIPTPTPSRSKAMTTARIPIASATTPPAMRSRRSGSGTRSSQRKTRTSPLAARRSARRSELGGA